MQSRVAIERGRRANLDAGMCLREPMDDSRKIPLEMEPEGKEIRHDHDAGCSFPNKRRHCGCEIRRAAVEKRRFYHIKATFLPHACRNPPHGFVGGFNRRAMRKNDDSSRGHLYIEYGRETLTGPAQTARQTAARWLIALYAPLP